MNRFEEIRQQFETYQNILKDLEKEYVTKKKGEIYHTKKMQQIQKLDNLKKKAMSIGTSGNICWVQGKRIRPNLKTPQIMVTERFNLYFINISESEASALVKLHIKNVIQYTIKFIRPGVIINSS